jgi:hypothetical protein
MLETITGATEKTNNFVDILPTNVGDLEIGDLENERGCGLLGIREEMIHHEDEEERTSLFGGLVLVIGLADLHPEIVRDVLLKVIVGKLKILFKPRVR